MRTEVVLSFVLVTAACDVERVANPHFDAGSDAQVDGGGTGGSGGTSGSGGIDGGDLDAGDDSGLDSGADASPCTVTCDGMTPHCDATSMTCVACLDTPHCANADGKFCNGGDCVECIADTDCNSATEAKCNLARHQCEACDNNTQCEGVTEASIALGVCDDGQCVECSASDYTACGTAPNARQNVCDALSHTCTSLDTESAGLCETCVSNAQCDAGQVCVEQTYGVSPSEHVGFFCFWRRSATEPGGPNGMCANVPPYFGSTTNALTIDGDSANICRLALTTCPGLHDFRTINCAPTGTPDDALCGFDHSTEGMNGNLKDAYCRPLDPQDLGQGYFCTVPCASTVDCPDFTCDMGATIKTCTFQ